MYMLGVHDCKLREIETLNAHRTHGNYTESKYVATIHLNASARQNEQTYQSTVIWIRIMNSQVS